MATTKTLTPTNQAITLAAFTEKPDNRTNVTNDDKLADAVNTLNSNLTDYIKVKTYTGTTNANGLIYPNNLPSGARMLNAYTSQGTIALMQFGPSGFRAYDLSNGAFNILANTEITITFMYKE